jgi:hypothetical protein
MNTAAEKLSCFTMRLGADSGKLQLKKLPNGFGQCRCNFSWI